MCCVAAGGAMGGDKDKDKEGDPRLRWVLDRLEGMFTHIQPEKFKAFASAPETVGKIMQFLDGSQERESPAAILFAETKGNVLVTLELPKNIKSSNLTYLYMVKVCNTPVSQENIAQELTFGDVNHSVLDHLETLVRDVYTPLLCTPKHVGWPDMVTKEVSESLQNFVSHIQIAQGHTRGMTVLPLPPDQELQGDIQVQDVSDIVNLDKKQDKKVMQSLLQVKDRIHALEGVVITWTKQIKSVVEQEPAGLSAKGAFPEPTDEIDFWQAKAQDLNNIFKQLQSEKVRRMLKLLDQSKSSYNGPFAKLCKDTFLARAEANDNYRFLKPLRAHVQRLQSESDFEALPESFAPILHTLLLIWRSSAYYNTPPRLVLLLQEIVNALIRQARSYLCGDKVFAALDMGETKKAIDALNAILRVFGRFKTLYFQYKDRSQTEVPENPWRMADSAVFGRVDGFLERCHDVMELTQTVLQFGKLGRTEIGGTKGRTLTSSVNQIHADFIMAVEVVRNAGPDMLDLEMRNFEDAFYDFRSRVKELDRRLSSLIIQGFDDCSGLANRFRLFDSFDLLLLRPIISEELEKKYVELISEFQQNLSATQRIFMNGKHAPPIPQNLPPIAGALTWCRGLCERIRQPTEKLKLLDRKALDRDEALDAIKMYTHLLGSMEEFERSQIKAWADSIEATSQAKLKNALLRRERHDSSPDSSHKDRDRDGAGEGEEAEASRLLQVNFDPLLVRLLREVKYFLLLGLDVPSSALDIYAKAEGFRRDMGNLDLIVNMYNHVHTDLQPVERPLFKEELERIDRFLAQGILPSGADASDPKKLAKLLNWRSGGIEQFIKDGMALVREAYEGLSMMKNNDRRLRDLLEKWRVSPIFERSNKSLPVEDFDQLQRMVRQQRYHVIKEGGNEIHRLVRETNKKLRVSAGHPDWKAYVDYINDTVTLGLVQVAVSSLEMLDRQLDPSYISKSTLLPLLEVDLDLRNQAVVFMPPIAHTGPPLPDNTRRKSVRELVQAMLDSFLGVGCVFKRLDTGEGNYLREIQDDPEVEVLLASIKGRVAEVERKADDYRKEFLKYTYLWSSDVHVMFQTFLEQAVTSGEDDADTEGGGLLSEASDRRSFVDLDLFDEQIRGYLDLQAEIAALRHVCDVDFLHINAQPIKQAMSTWVAKWIYLFTQYLQDFVSRSLRDIDAFLTRANRGLEQQLSDGDMDSIMAVTRHIRDVRKRMPHMESLFEPLKDMVGLLRNHGVPLDLALIGSRSAHDYLEAAPVMWESVVNKAFKVKEEIQPLHNSLTDSIRKDIGNYNMAIARFVETFHRDGPFHANLSVRQAYAQLSELQGELCKMEDKARSISELEELFELAPSKFAALKDMRTELVFLKATWDMVDLVENLFSAWKTTLWSDITDTDALIDETRALQTQIKRMNRRVREWGVYKDMEERVANMATVLPLVNHLHSPAMRDRHWRSLVVVTKKTFEKTPAFALQDLLALNLHLHVEGVNELVQVAQEELKVETKLRAIEEFWRVSVFDFVRHRDTEVYIINTPDLILEALEEHSLQLQNMVGLGKSVDFFRDEVLSWQHSLGVVEAVLKMLLNVQRQWASLEAIFMGSADIRSQLPDDSKRFEDIDTEFKDLLKELNYVPNVARFCNADGREHAFAHTLKELEKCQKALNEYLEKKKKMFPRFYFVSNVALLDMLSNGNNPPLVMPHLGSVFDGIATLELEKIEAPVERRVVDEEVDPFGVMRLGLTGRVDSKSGDLGRIPKTATAMLSKDAERVAFYQLFHMSGAVEGWLAELVACMQHSLKVLLEGAISDALSWDVEKPREEWLFGVPAQLALLASQVMWTEEVEAALEELESGAEDAVKKYLEVCNGRLEALIRLVQGSLSREDRNKIITLITIDVHSRDVVTTLLERRVESGLDFTWQSQLRYYWEPAKREAQIRICDFRTLYSFEYIGNCGRLVITPLTDRCYVTLTTALRLMLGGAPAGPAGTGKTETTKDLARGVGLPCYVFNCSDQMNYQTMADIFKGLAQVGAWGCFDEFNRIPIEVLSVVASQVKAILDAIQRYSHPAKSDPKSSSLPAGAPPLRVADFDFFGDTIALVPTCGVFITMNPGYAGRTELPENLKALFRSCAMIRPDLKPISENMLMAEGFVKARPLSVKFVVLYELSSELLSKQNHYDWGLRAVKSVLRVAGMLKRADPQLDEEAILMRALRDFNTPKIPTNDTPIFLRLIRDLFPNNDLKPKVNESLRDVCIKVCQAKRLQPEEGFVNKVLQYDEILQVRHSVMLLAPPGAGKTCVWKTLLGCYNWKKAKPVGVHEVVNPKAVTTDELYGYMTLTKDWRDGILSIVMRNMSKEWSPYSATQTAKWVVLDGDIDAVWIESMNTVMDDNKMLTLVSNERIPLSDSMRMIFEIHSLKNATPATVSRAGILYLNETDVGYGPFVESWIRARSESVERDSLQNLFDKHVPVMLDLLGSLKMETLAPTLSINMVQTLCYLLEGLLPLMPDSHRSSPEMIERLFLFAAVWGFGATAAADKNNDFRKKFSLAWQVAFKGLKFPEKGSVFDYMVQPSTGELQPWADLVPKALIGGEAQFGNIVVPTVDLTRLTYLTDLVAKRERAVLFVGSAGTGKTTLVREYLHNTGDGVLHANINMNYYTDAAALQQQLERPIDKRSGKTYGPPPGKKLIYFIDDLNMPFVEAYGTQTPIELLRQHADYRSFYDRSDLSLRKTLVDVQYIAALNPKCGSFVINPRLQRHFVTFGCQMPSDSDLHTIYGSILRSHLVEFPQPVQRLVGGLLEATVGVLKEVSAKFLPSAVKFHYNFNMRDLANVVQGMLKAVPDYHGVPLKFLRLWLHECTRVFSDRLIYSSEIVRCRDIFSEVAKRVFAEEASEGLFAQPLIFTSFITSALDDTPVYAPVASAAELKCALEKKLCEYNECNAMMDLVLFEDAIDHVCRIARIISLPRGNALLVGVGGSGKQSLSKLAAFICGYSVVQISVTSDYGLNDLKESMKDLYRKAGVKPAEPLVFMLTDSQVVDERFLVFINDLLSSGVIPDLFAPDELDALVGQLRGAAKASAIPDSRDSILDFFIDRVRNNLHVILAFSPVGHMFRVRARRFPALINCTAIDWFQEWPKDALINVAQRFLADVQCHADIKENVSHHMSEVHLAVNGVSAEYYARERRYNYTTPRSFLELIHFFKDMLAAKRALMHRDIHRLSSGLITLQKTNKDVEGLKEDLKVKMRAVEGKKAATEELLLEMGIKRAEAEGQQAIADKERQKADAAANMAREIELQAADDLAAAKPALDRAQDAVNCLDKASMTELKSFSKPPSGVDKVTTTLLIMMRNEKKNFSWDNAKKMMAKVDGFKDELENYRGQDIPEDVVARVQPYLEDDEFTYEKMKSKSAAAANLCNWVINIVGFNRIYKKVRPLMDTLEQARAIKAQAESDLAAVMEIVAEVEHNLSQLQAAFMDATEEKTRVEAEAKRCQDKLSLAERLTNGLSSENTRWAQQIESMRSQELTMVGDVLLAAAFVSYAGAFGAEYRDRLWRSIWMGDLIAREIPVTPGIDPLSILALDSVIADWMNNGLPADRTSIENGAMVTNSQRWPLIIDPQLQGIKWLKAQEEARLASEGDEKRRLHVIQLGQKKWMSVVTNAMTQGHSVVIENVGESIDAVLDPVLSRAIFRKGKNLFIKMGGEDVDYDTNFKLFLQTNLANPHYRPEIFAQCTLINFIVTEKGLEDQLLAKVVAEEQPALEQQKNELVKAFNQYKIQLGDLEDQLLERLANAPEDILSDIPLIEGLEATKKTALAISEAVKLGKETEKGINEAREVYRPVASEASLLYFMLLKLYRIDHMYQYSLDSFSTFFRKSMRRAEPNLDNSVRSANLCLSLRWTIYTWVARGLFEKHRLIFLSLLAFTLLQQGKLGQDVGFSADGWRFLLRGPRKGDEAAPVDWLPKASWGMIRALSDMTGFEKLAGDVYESAPRFKEWFNHVTPEGEKLPLDWRELDKRPFLKLLVVRCMRPDRLTVAIQSFVRDLLPQGEQFVEIDAQLNSFQILEQAFSDSSPHTPIYFILSPGANIGADVDKLAAKAGMLRGLTYHNISLGQGQDVVAMEKLEAAHHQGHWVVLNNVHLMPRWLKQLQKRLDEFATSGTSHEQFRVLLSSDPSATIPVGILERSIKLTNDPPSGLKANLKQAFCCFSREEYEEFEPRTRGILFGLCHFHAIMLERKKFGAKGYNMVYPFSMGDLTCSASVLKNYMENAPVKVPWQDLRYLFGEIMYGGHIVNDFDRLVCATYLDFFMKDGLMDGMSMFPYPDDEEAEAFSAPPTSSSFDKVLEHIDMGIPADTPLAFGLHPNAEIGFRTEMSENLFRTIVELSPQEQSSGEGAESPQLVAEATLQDILDLFRDSRFELDSIKQSVEDMGPFQNVFLMECERMNGLLSEMIRSLVELDMGFKGDLTMSEGMEMLQECLFMERVPVTWERLAFPSLRSLPLWLVNLQQRHAQLSSWVGNTAEIPMATWVSGLFNPQSFLTAITQVTAQSQNKELDKLAVVTEVTKKSDSVDVTAHSRDGAFITGLCLEGARWHLQQGCLERSNPREMYCPMPIINCKAAIASKPDPSCFNCPVYKTQQRGPTYVFTANLKTKAPPAKWVLAGVVLIMDIV